jgi:hypothetical protein
MLSAAVLSGRPDPCCLQDAPHTRARELDAIAFGQQIAQMLVIASCVGRARQLDHLTPYLLTNRLYRLPASIPMGQRSSAFLSIRCIESPHLPF